MACRFRWPWLRARIHWLPFLVFNLTFIAVIQVGRNEGMLPGWLSGRLGGGPPLRDFLCCSLAAAGCALSPRVPPPRNPSDLPAFTCPLSQHLLLLALAAPAYVAWQNVGTPVGPLDAAAAALVAFFLLFEATADEQQWVFQTAKHALLRAGKPLPPILARGFCTTGLFRYSRHPK